MTTADAILMLLPVLILIGSHEWQVRRRARRASMRLAEHRNQKVAR